MICSSCGNEIPEGETICPMCGKEIEKKSDCKGMYSDQFLHQQKNEIKKENVAQKEETTTNIIKRTPADWWENWICSNCGIKNRINQNTCQCCHLDIQSSFALGIRNGTISQEEEKFYYERVRPHQMQIDLLQKQNDALIREKMMKMSQDNSTNQTNDQRESISVLSILSLVVGIFAIFASVSLSVITQPIILVVISLLAILFSISPIKNKKKGRGMAIAGLVCGLIALAHVVMIWSTLTNGYKYMFD